MQVKLFCNVCWDHTNQKISQDGHTATCINCGHVEITKEGRNDRKRN